MRFNINFIDYLSHSICPGRVEVSTLTIDAVHSPQRPTSVTELQYFLGFCNVFRRFVPNFAQNAAPLNKKLRKRQLKPVDGLNEDGNTALERIKSRLV